MAGVMILGASGAGKSRLALALIDAGAQLVADDQVIVMARGGALYARAPAAIAGLIEARGIGLLRMNHRRLSRITLAVELGPRPGPRLPDPRSLCIEGIEIALLRGTADGLFATAIAHYVSSPRPTERHA